MTGGSAPAVVAADPTRIEGLGPEELVELIAGAEALKARLWAQLLACSLPRPAPAGAERAPREDRLLSVAEAAARLGVAKRWMYRHADDLPFTRRLSGGTLRFSERGLERWMESRR